MSIFSKLKATHERADQISHLIVDLLASEMLPLWTIESDKFKALLNYLEVTHVHCDGAAR